MATRTRDFVFASAPKTGCRWMAGVIEQLYPGKEYIGNLHQPVRIGSLTTISFVRDPADWLRSFYQNRKGMVHHQPADRFLELLSPEDNQQVPEYNRPRLSPEHLDKFVTRYLYETPPNTINELYYSYPGDKRWRIEDMPQPLNNFLGIQVPLSDPHPTTTVIDISTELRQRVYEHEPLLCKKWNYPIEQ